MYTTPAQQRPAPLPALSMPAFAYKRCRLPRVRRRKGHDGWRLRGPIEPEEAVSAIRSGDTVMVGGFGLVGAPLTLIDALVESSDADELTIVSNNIGEPGRGLGKLLRQGRIKRGISSYFTSNPEAVAAVNAGEIEATLVPQGTFAEAIRAAGAGIAGFLTPVGAGTLLAEGRRSTSSTASRTCSKSRSTRTSRSSTRRAATSSATSGTGARRATSTR